MDCGRIRGVPENGVEAFKWYRKAAEQGDAGAQFNLGNMYEGGEGAPVNYVNAYLWSSLSVAQGNKAAKASKEKLAKLMTKEHVAKAQKLSTACFANNYKNCD